VIPSGNYYCTKMRSKEIVLTLILLSIMWIFGCQSKNSKSKYDTIVLGTKTTLYSKVLNQEREIWIYTPDNYNSMSSGSPVLYLLDAKEQFNPIVEKIRQSGKEKNSDSLSRLIVVGILNIDRVHDLTPSNDIKANESSFLPVNDSLFLTSGGGDDFILFIKNELIPYIDSSYQTSSERIFAGHSLGGLLVIHTLLNHSGLFTGYIAVDPSLWWNTQEIVSQTRIILPERNLDGVSFFLANSGTSKRIIKINQHPKLGNPYHIQLEFKSYFEEGRKNKLRFFWKYYKNENHGSISGKALFDGLPFMFNEESHN